MKPESRASLLGICEALVKEQGVGGVVLGCTELELLLPPESAPHLVLFPSAQIHIESAARVIVGAVPIDSFKV